LRCWKDEVSSLGEATGTPFSVPTLRSPRSTEEIRGELRDDKVGRNRVRGA
jgi:hypothetical protein